MKMKHLMVSALVTLMVSPAFAADSNNQDEAVDKQGQAIMDARGNCVNTKWEDNDGRCGRLTKEERTVYFDFNKSTIRASERAKLDSLIRTLKGWQQVESVDIYGHADMIGDGGYNSKLSRKRAEAVKSYLWNKGVKVRKLDLRALGESQSVTKCDDSMSRKELISCLAADRRVEIELNIAK